MLAAQWRYDVEVLRKWSLLIFTAVGTVSGLSLRLLPGDQHEGYTMKNMLHYTFVKKNKFGGMSQVPCCKDSAKCLRVCEIKANRYIGSSSRSVKLCQWREENHQRLFPVRSTAGGRDLQGLIVHQLEAAEILLFVLWLFFVLRAACLPTQVAWIHTTGNLKSTMEKPWDTHTQIIDRPQSQPVTPTFSSPSRSHLLQESMEIKI